GSLITDIPGEDFKTLGYSLGEKISVKLDGKPVVIPYQKTFMEVPVGQSLLYIDSRGRVGLAVNQGDYSRVYKITPPVSIFIPRKGE
ncbi:MAG: SAM hydroxide adenosyltransferase, partial [Candidatus Acidiferrales bacterium]